jgi:methionyl-tRNA formyltransferase
VRVVIVTQVPAGAHGTRVERGDPGDAQRDEGATYAPFFGADYACVDWSRPAVEIARQVRAGGFTTVVQGPRGALAELDRETVRLLRVSVEPGGGRPVECGEGTLWILETEPA